MLSDIEQFGGTLLFAHIIALRLGMVHGQVLAAMGEETITYCAFADAVAATKQYHHPLFEAMIFDEQG